jgi:type I restriction enzyme S subunit
MRLGMTTAIDITTAQRKTLLALLRHFIPGAAVWAYGSRVKWTARPNSDLDLVVFTTPAQSPLVSELKDALAESNVPFPVDLHIWDEIPERFHQIIRNEYVVFQEAEEKHQREGLPDKWKARILGELTENSDGQRIPVKEAERKSGPYPYYGASGIVDHVDKYIFDGEYLLIAEDGENLRTQKTPIAFLARGKFWVNNHAHIVTGNGLADTRFLMYALNNGDISGFLTGSTMPKLTQGNMNRIPILAPPLSEQRAISSMLGSLDDKIELNRRMNETLEALAQSLFKSWFVDFDPFRAKGRRFKDSLLGKIPEGWSVSRLKALTNKIGSGATPRGGSAVYVDEGVALIRSQNVYDHEFHWPGLARLTNESAAELQGVEVKLEDILFNITGDSILRTCVVDPDVLPARVNQHVVIIRAAPGIPPRFLHLYLVQPRMKYFLGGLDAGATRQAVTKAQLELLEVLQPPQEILDQFATSTEPLFKRIESNRSESRTLAALRDALLPKLLSGELRVPAALHPLEAHA